MGMTDERATEIRRRLLTAYDEGKRSLPWRDETDPYRIWVSEVMLQQTRVETVIPYYRRWLERFPTLAALAEAEEDDVLRTWQGLGYYSRARRLHSAAMVIRERHAGALPSTVDDLKELPGVGEYTAGAVASIAFGQAVPAVDGNVRRVLSRLFDLPDPGASELRELASALVDPARPGDFNQAMMELGATACTPRAPTCSNCPLGPVCESYREGTVEERPLRKVKKAVPEVDMAVLVAVWWGEDGAGGSGDSVPAGRMRLFLRKRPASGLLAGMWEFPGVEMVGWVGVGGSMAGSAGVGQRDLSMAERAGSAVRALAADLGMSSEGPVLSLETVPHQFSHLKARYHPVLVRVQLEPAKEEPAGRWVALDGLDRLALPVAQQKIASLAMEAVREWE